MKKIIILIIIASSVLSLTINKQKYLEIPSSSIRLRIVPNSNSLEDQYIKGKVKEKTEKKIYSLLKDVSSIEQAREVLRNNLNDFNVIVEETFEENEISYGYNINLGNNYFPEKKYKGVTYKSGIYESILITLGKAEGDNWWCVLFPPLCLLEAEEFEETKEVEYQFLVKRLVDKIMKQ